MQRATTTLDGAWRLARYAHLPDGARECPETDGLEWIAAQVPGAIPYDLVRAGRLENPLSSARAARAAAWVAQSDWLCSLTFDLDPAERDSVLRYLCFDCVDTFTDVWLNGVCVGSTDNMLRPYRFDLGQVPLRAKGNELLVHLKAHRRMVAHRAASAEQIAVDSNPTAHLERSLVRRYQRSYSASLLNLGTEVASIGIPGSVRVELWPEIHIEDYHFATRSISEERARVSVEVSVHGCDGSDAPLQVEATLSECEDGAPVCAQTVTVVDGRAVVPLDVSSPRLWWPRGYGDPHLYHLSIRVLSDGQELDSLIQRVGIKAIDLVQELPGGKKTFYLAVNGRKVYVRGGNLIPIDCLKGYASPLEYRRMLRLAANANMNTVRIWGGGLPEHPAFLDLCDEMGIMVWQDFCYHSCTYPDHDLEFMRAAEEEASDLVRTMRNRACLVLLCGGNEQIQGWDEWNWREDVDRFYGEKLFNELLPAVAARHAPEIPYIPNSPHGGRGCQSPLEGDTHTWGNFYNATKDPLFVTETCWCLDSYSRPETLLDAMDLDVDDYAYHGWHRAWTERTGIRLLSKFPYSTYRNVESLRAYLHALEIEQAEADYHALAMLRLRSKSCSGIIYWPLNKGGPLFGFGCIDYGGRPLMAYYAIRRLFADIAIGLYRDIEDVRVVGSNLGREVLGANLRLSHLNSLGQTLRCWQIPVSMPAGENSRLFEIDGFMEQVTDRADELVFAQLVSGNEELACDRLLFCPLSDYRVLPGEISATAERIDAATWLLDIETEHVAPMLSIESNCRAICSDNYFALVPGERKHVRFELLGAPPGGGIDLSIGVFNSPTIRRLSLRP